MWVWERKESGLRAVRERKRFTQNETRLFHKIMATDNRHACHRCTAVYDAGKTASFVILSLSLAIGSVESRSKQVRLRGAAWYRRERRRETAASTMRLWDTIDSRY